MPILTSSDFTTLMMFLAGLCAVVLLVGLRYTYLLQTQEQVQEPLVCVQRWLPCEECGASTVPTALYNTRDNPFHIETLCTYCALCSDVEPFVIHEEEEEHIL